MPPMTNRRGRSSSARILALTPPTKRLVGPFGGRGDLGLTTRISMRLMALLLECVFDGFHRPDLRIGAFDRVRRGPPAPGRDEPEWQAGREDGPDALNQQKLLIGPQQRYLFGPHQRLPGLGEALDRKSVVQGRGR